MHALPLPQMKFTEPPRLQPVLAAPCSKSLQHASKVQHGKPTWSPKQPLATSAAQRGVNEHFCCGYTQSQALHAVALRCGLAADPASIARSRQLREHCAPLIRWTGGAADLAEGLSCAALFSFHAGPFHGLPLCLPGRMQARLSQRLLRAQASLSLAPIQRCTSGKTRPRPASLQILAKPAQA
jgi:hypothetical protein